MKNRFLIFLKKYWLCFLLIVIMVLGINISAYYAKLYETGSAGDMIRFDLYDLYLIYGIPSCSFIYGCLSYTVLKKAWFPQLILFATTFLYLLIDNIEAIFGGGIYILSAVPVVFSLIGTGISAFIYAIIKLVYAIIKSIKENKN